MIFFIVRLYKLLKRLKEEEKQRELEGYCSTLERTKILEHTLCAYVKNVRKDEKTFAVKRASIFDIEDVRHIQLASAARDDKRELST